jgi:hypothetical protein
MPEGFLSLIVTMLPAFREIEQRLDRETGRRFNGFNLFATNENATSQISIQPKRTDKTMSSYGCSRSEQYRVC